MQFKLQASTEDRAEILLYDIISPETQSSAKSIIRQLQDLKQGEITVRINSRGGDVFEGIAIYSYLVNSNKRIITQIDGLAASMASIIAMAGDEILISENGFIMIHNPWGFGGGDSKEFKKTSEKLDQLAATMVSIYKARTGLGKSEIEKMMDATTYLNADESLSKGFADKVIKRSKMKLAASIDMDDLPDQVIAAFNFDNDADEAEKKTKTVKPGISGNGGLMDELLKALGVDSETAAIAKIGELNSQVVTLQSEKATLENRVTALNTRLGKLQDDNAEYMVDLAVSAGEILPKDKEIAKTLLKRDPETFKNWKAEQKRLMGMIRGSLDLNFADGGNDSDDDIEVR